MNEAVIAISITLLFVFVIILFIPFFTSPRYRILEITHKNGEIDYTVQASNVFGLPGTWTTVEICMGYYDLVLRGCNLETAKNYVREFEKEDAYKRGRRIKKKKVWVKQN